MIIAESPDGLASPRLNGHSNPLSSLDAESEKRLHQLLHVLPAAIYTTDAFGRITFFNEAAAVAWGRRPELNSEHWCGSWRMYWPDGTPLPHDQCPMAIALKEQRDVKGQEAIVERPDGTRVPIMAFPSTLRDADGNVVGAVNMFVDITERKRAEAASKRAEKELRDYLENASVGMHWVGPDGIILWANRAEMEMLGFTREEYIGRHIEEFHVDKTVIDDILQRLTNGETLQNYESTLRCKNGSTRNVLINSNVLWDGDKFVHTRCFTRDITERTQHEQQIAILACEAEHRARNVLATVKATVHLTKSDTPEGMKQAIEGRIQALANVHTLFLESRWTGAELRSLVAQEFAPYSQAGETRVQIDGADLLLEPDKAQALAVTMHELVTNAAKYGALSVPNGHVHVEWSRTAEGRVVLRWTETGGPTAQPPTRQGFGTRVIEGMIRNQLGGDIRFDWHQQGLACEINMPA